MQFVKKNLSLVLGIAIPIVMIIFVAASIYLPGLFITPHYNFLYVSGDSDYYASEDQYSVHSGTLVKNYDKSSTDAHLYLYDVARGEAKEVTFEEAQQLHLDTNLKSPDDFEIVNGGSSGGFFPFYYDGGGSYDDVYLKGHNISRKLNLKLNGRSYYLNFRFLGWVQ